MDNELLLPPGELIQAGGTQFHVRRFGTGSGPTLVIEAGLTMMSSGWGWLAPALAQSAQVIAYDRAGLGWSDEREGLRDARQIAAELAELLIALKPGGPFVLLGHSMGAIVNRALLVHDPALAQAVIWLDPAHPDLLPRSQRMRAFLFFLEFAHLLAQRNLPSITFPQLPQLRSLPDPDYRALRFFLKNPRHLKTSAREARAWRISAGTVRGQRLGSLPLLIITAQKSALRGWADYQKDLAALSTHSRQMTFTDVSHISMLAQKAHAERAASEILGFLEKLRL